MPPSGFLISCARLRISSLVARAWPSARSSRSWRVCAQLSSSTTFGRLLWPTTCTGMARRRRTAGASAAPRIRCGAVGAVRAGSARTKEVAPRRWCGATARGASNGVGGDGAVAAPRHQRGQVVTRRTCSPHRGLGATWRFASARDRRDVLFLRSSCAFISATRSWYFWWLRCRALARRCCSPSRLRLPSWALEFASRMGRLGVALALVAWPTPLARTPAAPGAVRRAGLAWAVPCTWSLAALDALVLSGRFGRCW